MARANRTNSRRVASKNATKSARKIRAALQRVPIEGLRGQFGFEKLESRLLLSAVSPTLVDGLLTVTGYANEKNTISVELSANGQQIVASVDGSAATFQTSDVTSVQVNPGSRGDSISIDSNLNVSEGLTENKGIVDPTGTAASGDGSGSTSGSSSTATSSSGTSSSGKSSSGTSSSSSGTSSSGTSSSGSSSSTGASKGSSSGSDTTAAGSTSTGSNSGSATSSSTTTPPKSTTSGSGSSGSDSTGNSPAGNSSSGSSSTDPAQSPTYVKATDGTSAQISFTTSQTILTGLAVHVNALSSSLGSGSVIDATYKWNFGDADGQYNTLVGFNAAHQYNNPGTYTITLSITDTKGETSTATEQVVAQASSSLTPIYVSPDGNDSNSGASPDQAIQSINQLNNLLGNDVIVYFQAGATYDLTASVNIAHYKNVELTTYGSGSQPVLMYTGGYQHTGIVAVQSNCDGILINGLTFDSIFKDNMDANAIPTAIVIEGNNIVVTNCTFYNVEYDTDMSLAPTNVLIQNNSSPDPTALNGYFAWIQGSDIDVVGNNVSNSVGESLIRVGGADRILIADNNLANIADAGGDSNDIIKATVAIQEGNYCYVYGNQISSGSMGVGPIGVGDYLTAASSQFSYTVFDSNITSDSILIQPNSFHTAARNNVLFSNATTGGFVINSTQGSWQAQDIYISYNTVIDSSDMGQFLAIYNGEAQGIHLDNNLFIAPSLSTGSGQGLIVDYNNDLNSFTQIQNNVWAVPATTWWSQGGYFYIASTAGVRSGYITPQEWEGTPLANGSYPTGDIYEGVVVGPTYSVFADGILAGSSLSSSGS